MITRSARLGVQLSTARPAASDYDVSMEPLLVVALMTLSGVIALLQNRRTSQVSPALGFVSQQWLAEHRASHPS